MSSYERMDDDEFARICSDDQKMNVMYSSLRDKSVNPQSWQQKMNFWQEAITRHCHQYGLVIIEQASLAKQLTRNGRTPQCLDAVIAEMKRSGKLKPLSTVESEGAAVGWLYWGYSKFIRNPLSWAVGLASSMIVKNNKSQEECMMEVLKKKADHLLDSHLERVRTHHEQDLIDYDHLMELYADLCKDKRELPLLISHLVKQKKALIVPQSSSNQKPLIKFTENKNVSVSPVKYTDLKIYQIQCVEQRLEKQVHTLTEDIKRLTEEAKGHVKTKSRHLALHTLRRKKNHELILDKKLATLDILHELVFKIKNVSSDQQVLEAYECGVAAMKELTKDINLEKTENVIDELHDTFNEHEEVNQLLANTTLAGDANVDMKELEKELDELMKEDKPDTEEDALAATFAGLGIKDNEFPQVPAESPCPRLNESTISISPSLQEETMPLLDDDDEEEEEEEVKEKAEEIHPKAVFSPQNGNTGKSTAVAVPAS